MQNGQRGSRTVWEGPGRSGRIKEGLGVFRMNLEGSGQSGRVQNGLLKNARKE